MSPAVDPPLQVGPAFHANCGTCGDHDQADRDAARRISDEMGFHLIAGKAAAIDVTNRWIAVRLSDGVSDHALYDEKADAVRLAPRMLGVQPRQLLYLQVQLTGMPPAEALHMLKLFRQPWLDTTAPVDRVNPYQLHPLTLPPGVRLA